MPKALLLALPWLAGADKLTLYTVASHDRVVTDLSAMTGPVFDLQGLADFFNLGSAGCRKDPPKGDDVVGSFTVEVDGNVPRSQACPNPQASGNRFNLSALPECYNKDVFPEACDFHVVALGVFLNVSSLAKCKWGTCLSGWLKPAFEAGGAPDVCRDVRGEGFKESDCEACTAESAQAKGGPWYGDGGSGWKCDYSGDAPPSSARWLPTPAMCKCTSK